MATKKKEAQPEIAKGDLVCYCDDEFHEVVSVKTIKVIVLDNDDEYDYEDNGIQLVCKAKDRHDK